MTDAEHRVLKFRPRTHTPLPAVQRSGKLAPDLSRYEQTDESPDDYRHRMIANAAAIVLFLANTLAAIARGATMHASADASCADR